MYDFSCKVALITGASRRLAVGHMTALRFAREGADLVLVSKKRPFEAFPESEQEVGWKGLESVAEEVRALGRKVLTIDADITSGSEMEAMTEKAVAAFGKIDILVNNAGVTSRSPVVEISEEAWNRLITVNLTGTFLCSKAVAKHMISLGGGGAIVNVSSVASKMASAGNAAYSAAKAGVNSFTQVLALELVSYGIRVNAVCPGFIETNMVGRADRINKIMRDEGVSHEEAQTTVYGSGGLSPIPMGRVATPEEVAQAIIFLASEEASYMTGQTINVTGGRCMH